MVFGVAWLLECHLRGEVSPDPNVGQGRVSVQKPVVVWKKDSCKGSRRGFNQAQLEPTNPKVSEPVDISQSRSFYSAILTVMPGFKSFCHAVYIRNGQKQLLTPMNKELTVIL